MAIYIKNIHVQNIGPLTRLDMELGKLNCVFGRNEAGKTHLVEFIIESLFHTGKTWSLRGQNGAGKVIISGLNDEDQIFAPDSRIKLDDLWHKYSDGMPNDFSRLLVVKGGELEMVQTRAGINKEIIKRFLSSQQILDSIEVKISKTIRDSQVKESVLIGSKRGEIKEREELEQQLKRLDQLFTLIDKRFSRGRRQELIIKRNALQEDLARQMKAKQHLAYKLDTEKQRYQYELSRIPENLIQDAKTRLYTLKQREEEYRNKSAELKSASEQSRHFDWLTSAADYYETFLAKGEVKIGFILPLLAAVFFIASGVFTYLNMTSFLWLSLGCLFITAILLYRKAKINLSRSMENTELKRIQQEYDKRFDSELTGLTLLKEKIGSMQEAYGMKKNLEDSLKRDKSSIDSARLNLEKIFFELAGTSGTRDEWESILASLTEKAEKFKALLRQAELELARLDVEPSNYSENAEVVYSKDKIETIERQIRQLSDEVEEEDRSLDDLKRRIYAETNDSAANNWEDLINNLGEKRRRVLEEYKQKTAEIIGKMCVCRVVENFQKGEDAKIQAALESECVKEPLRALTGKYDELIIDGDQLLVSNPVQQFPIDMLSTGAREQTLLALRIGFAMQLARRDSLFLLLDDAFQHSDWQRRERLIDLMVKLVEKGWQINYFTMDNHIKDLFDKAGKKLGNQYRSIILDSDI